MISIPPLKMAYIFTDSVHKLLKESRDEAARLRHNFINSEHVLYVLVSKRDESIEGVLADVGIPREQLKALLKRSLPQGKEDTRTDFLVYTASAKKAMENSLRFAKECGESKVDNQHLFAGIVENETSLASKIVRQFGVTVEEIKAAVMQLV